MKKLWAFGALLSISVCAFLLIGKTPAFAVTKTWVGGSGNNLSTAANWGDNASPSTGLRLDIPWDVIMPTCPGSDVVLNNDIDPATVTIAGIIMSGSKPAGCTKNVTITGNDIKTSGDIDAGDYGLNLDVDVTITAPVSITRVYSTGSLSMGANALTIADSSFDGGLSGSGILTIESSIYAGGNGCYGNPTPSPFAGDSSGFSGAIVVQNNGDLAITKQPNDLARHAASITKKSSGTLSFNLDNGQDMAFDTPMTFEGGAGVYLMQFYQSIGGSCSFPASNKTITITSPVTFSANTTFYVFYANLKFTGTLTGQQYVKISDGQNGTITFPDNSTITSLEKVWTIEADESCVYSFEVNNKTVVKKDCSASIGSNATYPTNFYGTLAGNGTVGHIKIMSGGKIAPGLSPGCLNTGNLTFETGGIYDFEVGGATACTQYDQIKVTGTVTLGNGTLNTILYNGFKPVKNQSYTIITNDGTDAVSGTFKDLAEGATFTVNGNVFKISYKGGDGNDVVLTVISVSSPNTGFKLVMNNPAVTLAVTTFAIAGILVIVRKQNKLGAKR